MIRPIRSPWGLEDSFTSDLTGAPEQNARMGMRFAGDALKIRASNDAAKRVAQAQMELQSAGGGGGIGSWLGAASQALGAIGGIAGWGKGGRGGLGDLKSGFSFSDSMKADFGVKPLGGAGNFSSFYN